jgi:carbon storage regulator
LTLSRRIGEKIIVAGNIVIKVLEIKHSSVRIGITAPHDIAVDREEIWARKEKEKSS